MNDQKKTIDDTFDQLVEEKEFARFVAQAKDVTRLGDSSDFQITTAFGKSIGPYTLTAKLGEGGMGVVYQAQQEEPVRRRVALKVIKPGMDSQEVIRRFQSERQALALMDHPNIASVFDAGTTENGLPFFVMELIQGDRITDFCDEHRYTVNRRLKLFVMICRAVQHAHQKGIIHRDLKPSNLLICLKDDDAVPKIIDFGVAKAIDQQLTEDSIQTRFTQMIGTPLYMSPEQTDLSSNDIDTRSDIYSLGVVLYELLAGSTPVTREEIRKISFDDIRRTIREDDPQRPSDRISTLDANVQSTIAENRCAPPGKLVQSLRGDLDWIIMKALDKDRERRYETAAAFADDIGRFLDNRPVQARKPSWGYLAHKYLKRHRTAVAITGVVVIASLAALAVLVASLSIVNTKNNELVAANRKEKEMRRQAVANAKTASSQSQLALSTLTRVVFEIQDSLKKLPGAGDVRRRLLIASLEKLKSVATEFVDQSTVDKNTVAAMQNLGATILQFGMGDETQLDGIDDETVQTVSELAQLFFERSVEIARQLVDESPEDVDTVSDFFSCIHKLGDFYHETGQLMNALKAYEEAAQTAIQLQNMAPESEATKWTNGIAASNLGMVYESLGQNAKALPFVQQALDVFLQLAENDNEYLHDLWICYDRIGRMKLKTGQTLEAVVDFDSGLDISRQLCMIEPEDVRWQTCMAGSWDNLAEAYARVGRQADGVEASQNALSIRKQIVKDDPQNLKAISELAQSCRRSALRHLVRRDFVKAESDLQLARENLQILLVALPDSRSTQRLFSIICMLMGDVQQQKKNKDAALENYKEGIDIQEELVAVEPENAMSKTDLSASYGRLGTFYLDQGQMDQARSLYRKSVDLSREVLAVEPESWVKRRSLAISNLDLGNLYFDEGNDEEALSCYREFADIYEKLIADDPGNVRAVNELTIGLGQLGATYRRMGDIEHARSAYQTAVDALTKLDQAGKLDSHVQHFIGVFKKRIDALTDDPE